jgi:hypothetical protein
MFVAIILVCAAVLQDMRDCTAETANQVVTVAQTFSTEDECRNRTALLDRTRLLHERPNENCLRASSEQQIEMKSGLTLLTSGRSTKRELPRRIGAQ